MPANGPKWEYMVFEPAPLKDSKDTIEKALNRFGQESWELVGCTGQFNEKFLLKRALAVAGTTRQSRSRTDNRQD